MCKSTSNGMFMTPCRLVFYEHYHPCGIKLKWIFRNLERERRPNTSTGKKRWKYFEIPTQVQVLGYTELPTQDQRIAWAKGQMTTNALLQSQWLKSPYMALAIKEIQIKTILRFYLTPVRIATMKNTNNSKC
jgi:hypothetical protein